MLTELDKRIIASIQGDIPIRIAAFSSVSHCYRRSPKGDWPYNLYTMIHAKDEASCLELARNISTETSIDKYTILFSREELKKTSMEYFPTDDYD
jgi:DNA-binding Lrp family transcriptional regulator